MLVRILTNENGLKDNKEIWYKYCVGQLLETDGYINKRGYIAVQGMGKKVHSKDVNIIHVNTDPVVMMHIDNDKGEAIISKRTDRGYTYVVLTDEEILALYESVTK